MSILSRGVLSDTGHVVRCSFVSSSAGRDGEQAREEAGVPVRGSGPGIAARGVLACGRRRVLHHTQHAADLPGVQLHALPALPQCQSRRRLVLSQSAGKMRRFYLSTAQLFRDICSVLDLQVTAAGKAVLVTGSDATLGFALARQLDDLGFTVFAGCLRPDSETAQRLRKESSGRLHVLALDVTSDEQVRAAQAYVALHLPTRAAGRVVNVVSLLGRIASPARAPYCAAKFAVEALADCLRLEMRRWGVDVVLVEPGDALTGSLEWFSEERVLRQAREAWANMQQEQRDEYGEKHFETVRQVYDYTKNDQEVDLGPVLRSLTDAVTRTFPLPRYQVLSPAEWLQIKEVDLGPVLRSLTDAVTRTFPLPRYQVLSPAEWLQIKVAEHLPRSVYDILYN
ncbi:hypothetical protein B566_EDAN015572 [Ephemera danica]|nr:hypothetical protein B566_EDAN015572 [Ephemera danica]